VKLHGLAAVVAVEWAKLAAQMKTRILLACCIAGPFIFAAVVRLQESLPTDTLFGRSVKDSGFAVPLVILGFAALWAFPVMASIVGGDLFAAEDRHATWKTVLTRSRSRGEIFAGKVITALCFSLLAVIVLGVSSVAAGALVIGTQPLIDLSGILRSPAEAFPRVSLAWVSVLPSAFGFTALAVLISVLSRSSAIGIGLPVVLGLTMQLSSLVDGPELPRRLLITSGFVAWHGLLTERPFYGPLLYGTAVSVVYVAVCLTIAYRALSRRDIGG
jgi:ABC-2 type transport system permease protein